MTMTETRAEYMRRYRAERRSARLYDNWQQRTYHRAERILRERHRDEFDALLAEVREADPLEAS